MQSRPSRMLHQNSAKSAALGNRADAPIIAIALRRTGGGGATAGTAGVSTRGCNCATCWTNAPTVGWAYTAVAGSSTPNNALIRRIHVTARIESKPNSRKPEPSRISATGIMSSSASVATNAERSSAAGGLCTFTAVATSGSAWNASRIRSSTRVFPTNVRWCISNSRSSTPGNSFRNGAASRDFISTSCSRLADTQSPCAAASANGSTSDCVSTGIAMPRAPNSRPLYSQAVNRISRPKASPKRWGNTSVAPAPGVNPNHI